MFSKPRRFIYNPQQTYTNSIATVSIVTGALFGVFLLFSVGYFMLVAALAAK